MSGEIMGYATLVQSLPPAARTAATTGTYISLKNYPRCGIVLNVGATAGLGTATLRVRQATSVAGAGAASLNFNAVWRTGARLYFTPSTLTGTFQVGEAVTGAGGGAGVIHSIHADHLVIRNFNNTAFVASELITGGTSGATANLTATNFYGDDDILVRQELAAATNQFNFPTIANKIYVVDIDASTLDVNNGYDCIEAGCATVGATATFSITYLLGNARYKGEPMESVVSN
ncbi:MAG: hypothetical protein WCY59_04180 [Anaerovoracaceae bacterium]